MILDLTILDIVVLSLTTIFCLLIIFTKELLKVLLSFLCVLLLVGVSFLLFNAGFLFVTQILLYVGGVSVLMVFVIMLSKRLTKDRSLLSANQNVFAGSILSLGAFIGLLYAYFEEKAKVKSLVVSDDVNMLGKSIVTEYLLAFELLAIFLLIALILAAVIAGKKQEV